VRMGTGGRYHFSNDTACSCEPLNARAHPFPDVGWICVLVPLCTENGLRFSARLADGTPEVHLERVVSG
jgi:hypothetical protein